MAIATCTLKVWDLATLFAVASDLASVAWEVAACILLSMILCLLAKVRGGMALILRFRLALASTQWAQGPEVELAIPAARAWAAGHLTRLAGSAMATSFEL